MAVDRWVWEAAGAPFRRSRHAVDGEGVRGGPHGPKRPPPAGPDGGSGRVGARGEGGVSWLGRRPTRLGRSGTVGKGGAMALRRPSASLGRLRRASKLERYMLNHHRQHLILSQPCAVRSWLFRTTRTIRHAARAGELISAPSQRQTHAPQPLESPDVLTWHIASEGRMDQIAIAATLKTQLKKHEVGSLTRCFHRTTQQPQRWLLLRYHW